MVYKKEETDTSEAMAQKAREEARNKKLIEERGGGTSVPKSPANGGQGKKNGNDEALAEAAKKAIFIELGKEGTMMITKPGEYNGVPQPPIVMIAQSGMSRIDKNNIIKSQWMRFSMLATRRVFGALKENKDYINEHAQNELEEITGLAPIE